MAKEDKMLEFNKFSHNVFTLGLPKNSFGFTEQKSLKFRKKRSLLSFRRFVVAGSALIKAVVPGSAQAYRFDEELMLSYAEVNVQ